jgi:hypothetical protein
VGLDEAGRCPARGSARTDGGGRRQLNSGEQTSRAGQQARVEALGCPKEEVLSLMELTGEGQR